MRTYILIVLCLTTFTACEWRLVDVGDMSSPDQKCALPPDLTPQASKCAAAKGLTGDPLTCVDFNTLLDQTLTNPLPTQLAGWDFTSLCPTGWEIANGKLQIKNFSSFMSICNFSLPAYDIKQSQYQKYSGLSLSIIQRIDINNPQHTAASYLGSPAASRTIWTTTGKSERQQLIISLSRTDQVPMSANTVYQYLFQLTSTVAAGGLYQGWQIESIAVIGNP